MVVGETNDCRLKLLWVGLGLGWESLSVGLLMMMTDELINVTTAWCLVGPSPRSVGARFDAGEASEAAQGTRIVGLQTGVTNGTDLEERHKTRSRSWSGQAKAKLVSVLLV